MLTRGLRHQIERRRCRRAVLGNVLLRHLHLCPLHAQQRILVRGLRLPVRQRRQMGRQHIAQQRQCLHHWIGDTGGIAQSALRECEFVLRGQHLGLQTMGTRRGFVCVGDRLVTQRKTVFRFCERQIDGLLLRAQQRQLVRGEHHIKVALRRLQHQVLLRRLPRQFGHISGDFKLPTLRLALGVEQRLARTQGPARHVAVVNRGGKANTIGCAQTRRGKMCTAHFGLAAHATGAGAEHDTRTPKRSGLASVAGAGLTRGLCHSSLRIVLLRGLPGLHQVHGMRRNSAQKQEAGDQ